MEHPTRVLVVAGPPGSGKSTLGEAVAAGFGWCLLDLDTLTEPLLDQLAAGGVFGGRHWNDRGLRGVVRPARYAALCAAIAAQRSPVVAVAPWTLELRGGEEWDRLVAAGGGEPRVVWLRAAPEVLRERRVGRGLDRDAHAVVDVDAPAVPHLALDARLPVAELVERLRRHVIDDMVASDPRGAGAARNGRRTR